MNLKSGTTIDRYTIVAPLSHSGGTASVYLATINNDNSRQVAIKVAFADESGATHEDMLLRHEADLLKQVAWRHPGIVRLIPTPLRKPEFVVRAAHIPEQPWYMAMEYLKGKSLAENLGAIQKFSFAWKLELFYRLLTTIIFIHDNQQYAHRDLKPGNIVFRTPVSANLAPDPVLVDFALAIGKDDLGKNAIIDSAHTPEYASRERLLKAMGEDASISNVRASDIWSLGLIFYEILTGKSLLGKGQDVRATIIREQLNPYLPSSIPENTVLKNLIAYMLDKDPENRPTASRVLQTLERVFHPPWAF
ncbi:MAG: hypothetical protein Fur0016_03880 [Anaerolineales bacterium]